MTTTPKFPEPPPQYPVSLWESIGIAIGAVLLVAVGLAGLGVKALNNAFNPQRAEAIARSVITYQIPGGTEGLFGANLGGAKIAVVSSTASPQGIAPETSPLPAIELLVARIPASQETEEIVPQETAANEFFSGFSFSYQVEGVFQVRQAATEYKSFCGSVVPVTVTRGDLTLPNQSTIPALKYEASIDRTTESYMAIITAVGQSAEKQAEEVFSSLKCSS